ncbi:hypothetical protein AB0953_12235 [Streptomyces sp. NPDC046866]|uniref:hypothetical protein n=1 Tax=Streptomyces sp. NPDC046866 TaxID=3154921 RepID=UPI003456B997
MIQTFPLALPGPLVDTHRIDFTRLYSTGWGVSAHDVAAAPNGDVYGLYRVSRYTRGVAEGEPDPARANFAYIVITRYSANGEVLASAVAGRSGRNYLDGTESALATGRDMTLCVLPDGTLSLSAHPNSTTLIAPDLSRVLAAYASDDGRPFRRPYVPGNPFAGSIGVTPSGRLLCVASEYGVWNHGSAIPNLVGLADGALTPGHKPEIRAFASLDPDPKHQGDVDVQPHVRHRGEPVGLTHRPRPALSELLAGEDRSWRWHGARLHRPVPLADDLFVLPVYARTLRGGSRGLAFSYTLVDDQGARAGSLQGLHAYRDSPFTGFCWNLASDPHRGRAYHLNRYGLYAWDRAGELRARLDTATKAHRPLTRFTLTACTPSGELLLVHQKQHLVLRVPVPDDLGELGASVEQALGAYARQRTALKKRWAPQNWHWTDPSTPVHHL